MENTIVTLRSENMKLTDGSISVAATYRTVGKNCPSNCTFLNGALKNSCYAMRSYVGMIQRRAKGKHNSLDIVANSDVNLIRHCVSGDAFKNDKLDKSYLKEVFGFHKSNPLKVGWFYTHNIKAFIQAKIKPRTVPQNLTILASCDNDDQIKLAKKHNFRYTRVVNEWGTLAKGEARCRYQLDKTTCSKCRLCFSPEKRIKGIVFKKH